MTKFFKQAEESLPLYAPGLEGIVAAETVLSEVDGEKGVLTLRGLPVEQVAGRLSFEAAVAFFWKGFVDTGEPAHLKARFGQARQNAVAALPAMKAAPAGLSVYEVMRLGLEALPVDRQGEEAISIAGSLPYLLAAADAIVNGRIVGEPDPALSSSRDMLRLLTGMKPTADRAGALDRYLVTILDHGLNASTFTARVIASTGADMRSCVIGAMGALKGPLHGGAPGPVLDMIEAIGSAESAGNWVSNELSAGRRIMGFGHRVYRQRDPRADVLRAGLEPLRASSRRLQRAEAVERAALAALKEHRPERRLETNVEFYTAVLLDAVGIDRALFTSLFAAGRSVGWCAHVIEQRRTGRLIRPLSRYVGGGAKRRKKAGACTSAGLRVCRSLPA